MPNPGDEYTAGDIPEEMTPEGLRLEAEVERRVGHFAQASAIDGYASAWEAGIQKGANTATKLARQLRTGEGRIKALEKENRILRQELAAFGSHTADAVLAKENVVGGIPEHGEGHPVVEEKP